MIRIAGSPLEIEYAGKNTGLGHSPEIGCRALGNETSGGPTAPEKSVFSSSKKKLFSMVALPGGNP
jgi:hypothetical protein